MFLWAYSLTHSFNASLNGRLQSYVEDGVKQARAKALSSSHNNFRGGVDVRFLSLQPDTSKTTDTEPRGQCVEKCAQ